MNGAEILLTTLRESEIDVCFANPGTSEMHFVSALDRIDGMRSVLALFEGVATGAADGYARMLDRPASTLLHLGPGLANGLSNLHNALRAQSPIVNVIGDHATHHRYHDAPLTSDVEGTARPFSHWVRTTRNADTVAADGAAAVAAARSAPGRVASLILPADAAWGTVTYTVQHPGPPAASARPSDATIDACARILQSGETAALVLAARATREAPLALAGQIAAAAGARLLAQTHTPRISRGAGRVPVDRIPYPVGGAIAALADVENVILVGAKAPVAFFAYPDQPSRLTQSGARIVELARVDQNIPYALEALRDALGAGAPPATAQLQLPERPTGPITPEKIGALLGAALPDDAIVIDESITTGRSFLAQTRTARPHDWILPTGGAIGYALPCAVGAAVACPDRRVVVLESDGSGLYMPQALWTMAREGLDVVTLVFANRRYEILRGEMRNVGVDAIGANAAALLDLETPTVDWLAIARGFGVQAFRATTMDELSRAFDAGLALEGPTLIEVVL